MIRFVIFDLDGTLVDTEPLHRDAFNTVLAERTIEIANDEYFERYIGFNDRDCFQAVLSQHGIAADESEIAHMIEKKHHAFEQLAAGRDALYAGAAEFVRACAARFPLMVVTGALRVEALQWLIRANLRDAFIDVIAAEDCERGKPAPDGFVAALGRAGFILRQRDAIAPRECLVVEDTPAGIDSAHAAGMFVLAVCHTAAAARLAKADFVRKTIGDVDLDEILRAVAARTKK